MSNQIRAPWRFVAALAVALLTASLPAVAQQPPARLAEAKQAFYKELGLTSAQVAKVEALEKKYGGQIQAKMTAMRKKYGETPSAQTQTQMRTEMVQFLKPIREASNKELNAILTPAQQKKIKELQARRMPGGMGAPKGR